MTTSKNVYRAAKTPTFYFIGVTTTKSSIMKVFPKWAEEMNLDAEIRGFDFAPHSAPEEYREVVTFIKNDPNSLGALVTTHKIDLYNSCKDLFDYLDPYAEMLGEISSISKDGGRLCGHAKDPISSGLALEAFIPTGLFSRHKGEVMLMGAGGSTLAMSLYYAQKKDGDVPQRIIITNRSQPRLDSAKEILEKLDTDITFDYILCPVPGDNDKVMSSLAPYSLVVNATGLGKDGPGSPVTDNGRFPENGFVWEINYRGDLLFKEQAEAQKEEHNLTVEDGWVYFIHGWTQVISEVFHMPIEGELLKRLSEIAKQ